MLTFDLSKIQLPDHGLMLDLGCGEGRHVFAVMEAFPNIQCVGLDPHLESLDKSLEGLEYFESISNNQTSFLSGSAYELPFKDNTFDLIICSEVLEHLHEYRSALSEVFRVLKPGGKFLASVPAEFPEKVCWMLSKEYQNQPGGHLRIFKKKLLIKDIEDKGFIFDASERFHSIHSAYWWLRCLFWKSQDSNFLVSWYKKFLELHILKKPPWIDFIDRLLNPILGKSISFYFTKK